MEPLTPMTVPLLVMKFSTWCRGLYSTFPLDMAARTCCFKGLHNTRPSTPYDMKPGTEFPCPSAKISSTLCPSYYGEESNTLCMKPSRFSSGQTEHKPLPILLPSNLHPLLHQTPLSPTSPAMRIHRSPSNTLILLCSGESTRNNPPNDHQA